MSFKGRLTSLIPYVTAIKQLEDFFFCTTYCRLVGLRVMEHQ